MGFRRFGSGFWQGCLVSGFWQGCLVLMMLAVPTVSLAQIAGFSLDGLVLPHRGDLAETVCFQVGVYMYSDANLNDMDWNEIHITIDYTLSGGMVLTGDPIVEISDFLGSATPGFPEHGIEAYGFDFDTDPNQPIETRPEPIAGSPCSGDFLFNTASAPSGGGGRGQERYLGNKADPNSSGSQGTIVEAVDSVARRLTLSAVHTQPLFQTGTSEERLVAIVEFPIDLESSPPGARIFLSLPTGDGENTIGNSEMTLTTGGDGSSILLGPGCLFGDVTVTDNLSGVVTAPPSFVSLHNNGYDVPVAYLDPQAGGSGGDLTFLVEAPSTATSIRVRTEGLSTFQPYNAAPATPQAGGNSYRFTTAIDGIPSSEVDQIPASNDSGFLFLAEFSENLGNGLPCLFLPQWSSSCSLSFDGDFAAGGSGNFDVVIDGAVFSEGRFGQLTGPNGLSVDLVTPSGVTTSVLSFDDAASLSQLTEAEQGFYQVSFSPPTDFLGQTFACGLSLSFPTPTATPTPTPTPPLLGSESTPFPLTPLLLLAVGLGLLTRRRAGRTS